MEYRILGKTGLKISRMGFGGIPIQRIDAQGTKALMQQHKISIDKRKIVQDDPIKNVGTYTLKAKLGYEIVGQLNLEVREA